MFVVFPNVFHWNDTCGVVLASWSSDSERDARKTAVVFASCWRLILSVIIRGGLNFLVCTTQRAHVLGHRNARWKARARKCLTLCASRQHPIETCGMSFCYCLKDVDMW